MFGAVPRGRVRLAFLASLSAAGVLASGLELPAVRDVSLSLPGGGRLEIGAIRSHATFVGIAAAQMPNLQDRLGKIAEGIGGGEAVTLENLTLDYGLAV